MTIKYVKPESQTIKEESVISDSRQDSTRLLEEI